MGRLYARLYLRHEMQSATFLTQTLKDLHRLSRVILALIRMVEKTLKASPLSNRRFERSEYPRYNPNKYVHLEEVPQQPVMNSKMSGHPFRVHISTHEYPECTDVYSVLLSGDAFSVIYTSCTDG